MPLISIVINCDTRSSNSEAEHMFSGCVNEDFLIDGVINKIKFFDGLDKEVIVYIDEHNAVPQNVLNVLLSICNIVVVRKHTSEESFNDWNYLRALSLASGDIICHVDQDTACFSDVGNYVDELICHLDKHKLVSYPSHWTPAPVHDDTFQNKWWASTRFFLCERETLKLDELARCIEDPIWMYEKYGDSPRKCNWLEHYLAKINGNDVFYPPVELHKGAIFAWKSYKTGTLRMLNDCPYEGIKQWIIHRGGIQYPVDVSC